VPCQGLHSLYVSTRHVVRTVTWHVELEGTRPGDGQGAEVRQAGGRKAAGPASLVLLKLAWAHHCPDTASKPAFSGWVKVPVLGHVQGSPVEGPGGWAGRPGLLYPACVACTRVTSPQLSSGPKNEQG